MSLRSARNKIGARNRIWPRSVESLDYRIRTFREIHVHDDGAGCVTFMPALLDLGQTGYGPHTVSGILKSGHQIRFFIRRDHEDFRLWRQ